MLGRPSNKSSYKSSYKSQLQIADLYSFSKEDLLEAFGFALDKDRLAPGDIVQLVERMLCKHNVIGSNPIISKTKEI